MAAGIEGRIDVSLTLSDGRIADVDIRSTRRVDACRVLEGRPAAEALSLLPRLFAICGTAQTHAAVTACEQASGVAVSPAQAAARRLLLLAETAREHAWRALLDWPVLLGEPPDAAGVRGVREALAPIPDALFPSGDWARPGGAALSPDMGSLSDAIEGFAGGLADHVTGGFAEGWPDVEAFERWCLSGVSAPARCLAAICDRGLEDVGAGPFAPLPSLDGGVLDSILAADGADGFAAAPTWDGTTFETGPLARCAEQPPVAGLTTRHGPGVLARMAARLLELVAAAAAMRQAASEVAADPGGVDRPVRDGTGLAMIEMARGRLIHRVELADGLVARYQIVAPTEWNFHPEGALAQGLRRRVVADAGDAETAAALAVTALDPCVAYRIGVG